MKSYTVAELKHRFIELGFTWMGFHGIGIRSKADAPNEFDDKFYLYLGNGQMLEHTGTTNPGVSWLRKFMNPKGTAVLAANRQYLETWKLGLHKGYEAMVQHKHVCVFRDNNKNLKSEEIGTPEWGFFAINHHRANPSAISTVIGNWSAGCQVRNNPAQYAEFINKFKASGQKFFSYTLLSEF
jgi:hypothetical protein